MVTNTSAEIYRQFADRLNEVCNDLKLPERGKSKLVGKMAGVGYKGAEKWLIGMGMPGMAHAAKLAVSLGVCFEWLMTGRGPKHLGDKPHTTTQAKMAQSFSIDDNKILAKLVDLWPRLSEDARENIMDQAQESLNRTSSSRQAYYSIQDKKKTKGFRIRRIKSE